jgi:hypothetical protein
MQRPKSPRGHCLRHSRKFNRPSLAVLPPREAPGVAYTLSAAAPGLKLFRCEPFRATLTDKGCGARWREAQAALLTPAELAALEAAAGVKDAVKATMHGRWQAGARRAHALAQNKTDAVKDSRASLDTCRSCAIGAAHAGGTHVAYSRIFGASICPRCRKGATRMIGGRVCVSCYNRGRELAKGRNGRGNRPVELMARAPATLEIRIAINGMANAERVVAVDRAEVMIQTLRTTKGAVEFGYAPPAAQFTQGRLF